MVDEMDSLLTVEEYQALHHNLFTDNEIVEILRQQHGIDATCSKRSLERWKQQNGLTAHESQQSLDARVQVLVARVSTPWGGCLMEIRVNLQPTGWACKWDCSH